jgi:hypothetical protein
MKAACASLLELSSQTGKSARVNSYFTESSGSSGELRPSSASEISAATSSERTRRWRRTCLATAPATHTSATTEMNSPINNHRISKARPKNTRAGVTRQSNHFRDITTSQPAAVIPKVKIRSRIIKPD